MGNKSSFPEGKYFQVPNAIFDNPELNLNRHEKIIYIYLCRCGNQGADAFPGYGGIAKRCGVSRATAMRAVKSLAAKEFITVTRRPKSNRDNESNLYQVNQLPSITGTLPLVSRLHQSSIPVIPNKEPVIKNQSINKGTVIVEDTGITPITGNVYPSGKSHAPNGLTSLTDKGAERKPNPPVAPTPLPLNAPTHGDIIEAHIRTHGSLDIEHLPAGLRLSRQVVIPTLFNDPRFKRTGRWNFDLKDNIPITADKSTDGSPHSKLRMIA